jgi:hypothetical protein
MKDNTVSIRVFKKTKDKIEKLAAEKNLAQVSVLEYLLNGKIDISELNNLK